MKFLSKIFGDPNDKVLAELSKRVVEINEFEVVLAKLSDEELKEKTERFKERLSNGASLDEISLEAFGVVREAAKRTIGQRHFDVQFMGGLTLHRGGIAEMKTGEGKTITSTLAIYLNALSEQGVHVITVNDYLAKRDTVWMGKIYDFLGLTVGCIQNQASFQYDQSFDEGLRPVARAAAYALDVTYGTNNEFGFDYLRDNMAVDRSQVVQRALHYAVIDEVDSILIDEARTPLIISGAAVEAAETYYQYAELTRQLRENEHYNVDEKMKAATFTEVGQDKVAELLKRDPWKEMDTRSIFHLDAALRAETLFKKDKDYVVKDGEVMIIDEFTGRMLQGRRYSEGLHQAIEAKENVKIQKETQTLATISIQNYFRLYKKLSGMTGTAATEAEEFGKIYNLDVIAMPTNKPLARQDLPDRVYKNEHGKFLALVKEIKERHVKGQPVLVGTVSIEKNELMSEYLTRAGIPHRILNAKNHVAEAEIVKEAGREGAVTVATNMAGRGVDIILGGSPFDETAADKVKALGGLFVLGTERHESRRIDNQLRGRAGRQGDPGLTQFYISTEDDLMRIFGSTRLHSIMERFNIPDDMPIENKMVSKAIESAQKKVEGHNFDIRKHLVEYDDVMNKHRESIYTQRRAILFAPETTRELMMEYLKNELEQVVAFHTAADKEKEWNLKEIGEVVNTIFPLSVADSRELLTIRDQARNHEEDAEAREKLINFLEERLFAAYDALEKQLNELFSDEQVSPGQARQAMREVERGILLKAIDLLWVEHLDSMQHLRRGIGLQGYGQRDPLVEYKRQAYQLFQQFQAAIQRQVVYTIFKAGAMEQQIATSIFAGQNMQFQGAAKTMIEGQGAFQSVTDNAPPVAPATAVQADVAVTKVGRNELCPCGSGKKFKKCHG